MEINRETRISFRKKAENRKFSGSSTMKKRIALSAHGLSLHTSRCIEQCGQCGSIGLVCLILNSKVEKKFALSPQRHVDDSQ